MRRREGLLVVQINSSTAATAIGLEVVGRSLKLA
jgi:hypothetical protein